MLIADSTEPVFDRLFRDAVPALLDGKHHQDEPPVDGGRWPVSVVCVPGERTQDVLMTVMDEALVHAGDGHFETGRADACHFTVRALEPYREAASPADQISEAWVAAVAQVGRESPPVRLRLTGVTLSVSAVMVKAEPLDEEPWELMRRLRDALGPLAWFEEPRDIWYATVVHFAAPILDAPRLVEWADERRHALTHDVVLDSLALVRFRHSRDGARQHMAMERWHSVDLDRHTSGRREE